MRQNDFNRAVARATGESVETINQRGFVLLTPMPFEREPATEDYEDFLNSLPVSKDPQETNHAAE